MNRLHLLSLVCVIFISACATTKRVRGPDGTEHLLVSCYAVESCYEQAAQECGGKYTIANSTSDTSGFDGSSSTTIHLLVKCSPGAINVTEPRSQH